MTPAIKHSRKVTEVCVGDIVEGASGLDRVRVTGVELRPDRTVSLDVEHRRGAEHGHGNYHLPADARVWVYA